jgi:two-component system OmpR family response regulator
MSRRVLVVEDDVATSDFLAKGLREKGYTVDQVADGRDGVYLAATSTFDVVVIDRTTPGLSALSVVKALRRAAVQTPILILSSPSRLDERGKGLRAGADDYLTKPYGFAELHARIEALVSRNANQSAQAPARSTRTSAGAATSAPYRLLKAA